MELIVISNPKPIDSEATIINALFEENLQCLHFRKPGGDKKMTEKLLKEIDPQFRDRISLHQHHEQAAQLGTKRLHFPATLRLSTPEERLHQLLQEGYILSTSVHQFDEFESLSPVFKYTFIGPVFDSISKKGYKKMETTNLFFTKQPTDMKRIALGGIDHSNFAIALSLGFDGLAVLGAIWEKPENAVASFQNIKNQMRIAHDYR